MRRRKNVGHSGHHLAHAGHIRCYALYSVDYFPVVSYEDYVAVLSLRMEELAKTQAKSMVEQERLLNQLDKLGSILSKYPQLDKLYKEGDVSQLLNLIRTFE